MNDNEPLIYYQKKKDAFSGLFHEPKSNRIHVKVYLLKA